MKSNNLIISIPQPCHEDWNKMTPNEKGSFCQKCSKTVIDFSTKTEEEIQNILLSRKDKKTCGRFNNDQLNNGLNKLSIPLYLLPKNISLSKAFIIAVFVVFGTGLFSCTNQYGHTVGEIAVIDTIPATNPEVTKTIGDTVIFEATEPTKDTSNCSQQEKTMGKVAIPK